MSSHCLSIPEIVQLICQHLDNGSLAEFARTNSSICATALDKLWSVQYSLVPLLQTLPQHEVDSGEGILLEEYIPPLDWANTQAYARRVKTMQLYGSLTHDIDDEYDVRQQTLENYILRLGGVPIFPNLRKLDFGITEGVGFQFLRYFMTSSLRSLTMRFRTGFVHAPRIIHILPSLPSLCPELEHLTIHDKDSEDAFDPDNDDVSDYILPLKDMVMAWSALTKVALIEAHHDVIRHLGRCPNLRYLDLRAEIDLNWLPAVGPAFENGLDTLLIRAWEGRFVAAILKCMSSAPIAVTDVCIFCDWDHLSKRHNIDVLARALDTVSLREFSYDHDSIPAGVHPLPVAALLQYTRFRNLIRFRVNAGGASAFDDEVLTEMVCAWPRLQHLSLCGHFPSNNFYPNITLSFLPTLARLCPMLKYFNCGLNTSQVPALPDDHVVSPPDSRAPSPQTVVLNIVELQSEVDDAQAMAEYISAVFKGKERFLKLDVGRLMWTPLDEPTERVLQWQKVRALVEGWDEVRVKRGY